MSNEKWSRGYELSKLEETAGLQTEKDEKERRKLSWSENSKQDIEKVLLSNLARHDEGSASDLEQPNVTVDHSSYASFSDDEVLQNSLKHTTEFDEEYKNKDRIKTTSSPKRNLRRARSLCRFKLNEYTIGDIRKLHERLATHQSKSFQTKTHFFKDFTTRQKLVLACLCLVDFTSFCSISMLAPFFPREAQLKGMSATTSGLVFSFYALVIFISSPFVGKILPCVGAKFVLMTGLFLTSTANFLFGLLENIREEWVFSTYSFLVQGLKALGCSAYFTAAYVYVAEIFPSNIGAVLGFLETFVGLGMSIGPVLGGFLYHLGGFGLPFYVLGILLLSIMPLCIWLLPYTQTNNNKSKSSSFFGIITEPSVIIISLVVIVTSSIWACLDPTLEPHLRQFDLTSEKIGLIFLLFSALYGLSSPLWGVVSDKTDNHWFMMTSGLFFSTLGLLLLGPAPFMHFLKSELWLNLVSLAILGVAIALSLIPTFQGLLGCIVDAGHRENETSTYSVVAGTWSSLYALGEVIGPLLGGIITENYGFPICCTVMAAVTFTLTVGSFIYFVVRDCKGNRGKNYKYTFEDDGSGDSEYTVSSDEIAKQPIIQPGFHNPLYTEENDGQKFFKL